ncbi:hypothetical protein F0562_032740 [Nyssa sinensis]|uniref:Uncharacterized protein n=1 Tax=Nyssa sinensis TaxID=561372 RepID=A0A5J5ATJ3_9ASTE|nr:hypothetical protein F0562_032740 [Nyssa sinensis]
MGGFATGDGNPRTTTTGQSEMVLRDRQWSFAIEMKRQRSTITGNGTAATTKKGRAENEKGNEEVGKVVVEEEEERTNDRESVAVAVASAEVLMEWDDQWPRWCSVGDEQMSWGSSWCPFWDLDFMGEAYNALYSDVAWDDDIWNLKGINEVPNP